MYIAVRVVITSTSPLDAVVTKRMYMSAGASLLTLQSYMLAAFLTTGFVLSRALASDRDLFVTEGAVLDMDQ